MKQGGSGKVEDLLKPRYKVVADYPDSHYKVGEILSPEYYREKTVQFCNNYPHLFKPLAWYEERTIEELPEYIRFYEPLPEKYSIWKINEWRLGQNPPLIKTDCDIVWRCISSGDKPATEADYNQYIKTINK